MTLDEATTDQLLEEFKKRCKVLVMAYIVPDDANGGHANIVKLGDMFAATGLARTAARIIETDTEDSMRYGDDDE